MFLSSTPKSSKWKKGSAGRVQFSESFCHIYIRDLKILKEENDYEWEIFSIVGSARLEAASFWRENVVAAGTSYQMLEVVAFYNRKRAQSPYDNSANFSGEKKYNEEFRGIYFLTIREKNFKSNLVLVVVLVFESKGFYS